MSPNVTYFAFFSPEVTLAKPQGAKSARLRRCGETENHEKRSVMFSHVHPSPGV